MSKVLSGLEPESVFRNFEELTKIPRESGNEKQVSDYLVKFAEENNLKVIQEECLNIIINKPGTAGYENAPRVILQGHMDIVCVKDKDMDFDFKKDPIPIVVDGDMIRTKGTTLGADNGIAVAMAMALLESKDIPHPPLTALITVAEETGMDGVLNLAPDNISGDILINMDSEEEGVFLSSCAGGVNNRVRLPVSWEDVNSQRITYKLSILGLLGGHSGIEINKNRANAINLLGRLLQALDNDFSVDVCSVDGGEKMNAIAKMASASIMIDEIHITKFENIIEEYQNIFRSEYDTSDPDIKINVNKIDTVSKIINEETKKNLIRILRLLPTSVQTMSANIEGLVESSNNVGVLETNEKEIVFNSAVRSSVRSLKHEINQRIGIICQLNSAQMELIADYPEWEYKVDSPIRELMLEVYKDMYNKEAKIDAIHAGLECGFLKQKVGDIDMISIGPNIFDVHTPKEHISISSTGRVYEFLCEVLKKIK